MKNHPEKLNKKKIFLSTILILIIFISGIWSERYDTRGYIKKSLIEFLDFSATKIYSKRNKIDTISIDIKSKNYKKLEKTREKALKYGRLKDEFAVWVPANILFDNENIKVRVKLKGTHDDHWGHSKKWSFKVKTKNKDKNIYGIKRFAVQNPITISYFYEWLFQTVLREENLIAHETRFVNLIVNGNDLGVYIFLEDPTKELIEKNKRKEGPIIRFGKELWIEELKNWKNAGINDLDQMFWRSKIKPVGFKKDNQNSIQKVYLNKAINLLESFRKKELKPDEVFDVDQLSKVMAIKAMFSAVEFDWKDIKFYYNPITELLEPIAREVHAVHHDKPKLSLWAFNTEPYLYGWQKEFINLLFDDPDFYEKYLIELNRVMEKNYLSEIIERNNEDYNKYFYALKKNYPTVNTFSQKKFEQNNKFLRDSLNPIPGINVNYENVNNDYLDLNISNLQILPVKIIGIKSSSKNIILNEEIFVKGKKHNEHFKKNIIRINCKEFQCDSNKINEYQVIYKILGQKKYRYTKIELWKNSTHFKNIQSQKNDKDILKTYSFFKFEKNKIIFKKGSWILKDQIIIPKNRELVIRSGTELIFTNKAQIVSFSPISIIGSENSPVILKSNFKGDLKEYRNNNNNNKFGFGILVIKANKKSIIKHAIFDKLSSPAIISNQSASGAISFYESDVEITNSKFLNNLRGDDYLNIVRSQFLLSDNLFENTNSDSIDIDFSNGIIKDSIFNISLNDAIDFSGSNVNLSNIKIINAGDKAISAGEQSKILIDGLIVLNSKMGIVSKDKTKLSAQNIYISGTDIAVAAYIKKNEYGPASIKIKDVKIFDSKIEYLKQKKSVINVDENLISDFNCDENKKVCKSLIN